MKEIIIIALLVIGGSFYFYIKNKNVDKISSSNEDTTINIISELESSFQNSTKEDIEKSLDINMEKDLQLSNDYFDMYKGISRVWQFGKVDLKVSKTKPLEKLLLITITPTMSNSGNISSSKILSIYSNLELHINPPEVGGTYYTKKENWGELRFGFHENDYLTSVTFDSTK